MGNKNHDFLTHRQKHTFFCRLIDRGLASIALCAILSSCGTVGLLVGNKDPVSVKADRYDVLDLSKQENSSWRRIDPKAVSERDEDDVPENEISDVVFQSKKTASVISLNSSCRDNRANRQKTLTQLTNMLLLGVEKVTNRKEKPFKIDSIQALRTTVDGEIDQQPRKLRIVVLKSNECVYDLMYFASPKNFPSESNDFDRFVASLKIER